MSVQSYLISLASKLVLKEEEKENITRSLKTLQERVSSYYGKEVINHFPFGSYTRGTILPRKADSNSDIDYMIIFNNPNQYKPQTFLNYLKQFVNYYYHRSEIYRDYPTVVLELNHIKFELVPAILGSVFSQGYQIPAPAKSYSEWMLTYPNQFNAELTEKNKNNHSLIKPLVRLMKYWNAQNGYIFSSYELERWIVQQYYLFDQNIKDYFCTAITNLPYSMDGFEVFAPQSHKQKIDRAKQIMKNVINFENSGLVDYAVTEIKKILPEF